MQCSSISILAAISLPQKPWFQAHLVCAVLLLQLQCKKGDAHAVLSVFGSLTAPSLPVEVQVVAYTVLTDLVRV